MAFFKALIRRESYIDIFVEAPDDISKLDVHLFVKKNLDKILKEVASGTDWDNEPEEVDGIYPCPKDEAELYPITKLEIERS